MGWKNLPHGGTIVMNNILPNSTLEPSLGTSGNIGLFSSDKFLDTIFLVIFDVLGLSACLLPRTDFSKKFSQSLSKKT